MLAKVESKLVINTAIAFFFVTLFLTLHRHFTFNSSYDQGIFNQVFWNGIHGRWFQSSLSSQLSTNVVHAGEVPNVSYHRLGQHFTPALLLWLPIYSIFPNPATLTVLQASFVTAAGVVLYFLARHYLEVRVAELITVSFYGAIAVVGPTLTNFHDISQIPLFVFSLLLAMEKRCWWLFGIFTVFILAVREDSGVILFGIGVYLTLSKRYPRLGLFLCAFSFLYIVALTNLIMPVFSEDIAKRFMLERFGQYAQGEEASTVEIIWGMISNPWRLLVEIATPVPDTLKYLLGQWLPLAFIPAVAPASWAIAGFPLLKLFMANGERVLSLSLRYAMNVVPGIFYGTILWWAGRDWRNFSKPDIKLTPKKLLPKFRRFWVFCLVISLFIGVSDTKNRTLSFLLPDSIQPWVYISLPEQWQHSKEIRSMLAQIPANASVSATTYLIPHLSSRRELLRLPLLEFRDDRKLIVGVDYAIADLWRLQRYQVAFKRDRRELKEIIELVKREIIEGKYGIIGFNNGVILLGKGVQTPQKAAIAWQTFLEKTKLDYKDN
ncbi:MAG: DUF2079 domain-containing protein [Xenococcaceae cyanobacterium]